MSPFPLLSLVDELLIVVLEHLEQVSPVSARACAAVCHRLYRLGVPIVYRHAVIYNTAASYESARALAASSQLPRFATSVKFLSRERADIEPLREWLRAAGPAHNLKVIEHEGTAHVSQDLLDDINELFPDAVIDVSTKWYSSNNDSLQDEDWEPCLSPLPCGFSSRQVRSLSTIALWDLVDRSASHAARCLEKIINSCPNLERLVDPAICASEGWQNHVRRGSILELNLDCSRTLPSLKEFAYLPLIPASIRSWGALNGQWQQLRKLKTCSLHQLLAFGDELPSLKHLTIASLDYETLSTVRGPRAPLESLHILDMEVGRVPTSLLNTYAQTLAEISIQSHGMQTSNVGFRGSDLSLLNVTCPHLQRVCLKIECGLSRPEWPPQALDALGDFEHLQEVFLGSETEEADGVSFESDEICLQTFRFVQRTRRDDRLRCVGMYTGDLPRFGVPSMEDEWKTIAKYQLGWVCSRKLSGELVITLPAGPSWKHGDYELYQKIRDAVRMKRRAFKRAVPWDVEWESIYWIAKNLGGSQRWAQSVLLPAELLSQEDLDDAEPPSSDEVLAAVRDPTRDEEWKAIVMGELQYVKRRRDFEARYGASAVLYDVLYPMVDPHASRRAHQAGQ